MNDFKSIKHICEENSKISSEVVDEFLIYYASSRNNLEQEMNRKFAATETLKSQPAILWFNMIAYNGACWQSYGPIGAYRSFEPDDIFFFATEIDSQISDENDLMSNLENDPIPYMMLLAGANYPLIANKNDQVVYVQAEYDMENMNTKDLTDSFITEYNKGVYRISLKKWNEHPHFSQAYLDESRKTILLSSMTDRGFSALVEELKKYGYNYSNDPFMRVHLTMVNTASEILKKKIDLIKYEKLFSKRSSPAEKENLDKLNHLINLALPDINAGREPDIKSLAEKAGLDFDTARDILDQVTKNILRKYPKGRKK